MIDCLIKGTVPLCTRFLHFQVDHAVFRDLDSLISKREKAAVAQWLESKHIFHVMRDHPNHGTTPMMAGMWGVKVI